MDDSELISTSFARAAGSNKDFLHRDFDDNEFRDKYGLTGSPQVNREKSNRTTQAMDFDDNYQRHSDNKLVEGRAFPDNFQNFDDQMANSDHEHFHKGVKRQNLINLFLQGAEIENYITTHLYGDVRKVDDVGNTLNQSIALEDILGSSSIIQFQEQSAIGQSILVKRRLIEKDLSQI